MVIWYSWCPQVQVLEAFNSSQNSLRFRVKAINSHIILSKRTSFCNSNIQGPLPCENLHFRSTHTSLAVLKYITLEVMSFEMELRIH